MLLSHYHPLNNHRSSLFDVIPYHFDLFKARHLNVRCLSPFPLEYAREQNTTSTKEISGKGKRGSFLVFLKSHLPLLPCRGIRPSIYAPSYPYTKLAMEKLIKFNRFLLRSSSTSSNCVQLTKMLTSERHVLDRELVFRLLGVSFPII